MASIRVFFLLRFGVSDRLRIKVGSTAQALIVGVEDAFELLLIVQLQTQQHARGSAQAELYPADIDRFVVPLLDADQQQAIGDLVRGSLVKQQESRKLLEQAKSRVEQLIEEAIQP